MNATNDNARRLGISEVSELKAEIRRLHLNVAAARVERDRYCDMVMQVRVIIDDEDESANAGSVAAENAAVVNLFDRIVEVVYPYRKKGDFDND